MYKYIHTCIYIHIYMSAHIERDNVVYWKTKRKIKNDRTHTHIHIYTHTDTNVHMNARKHAWNDGAAANVRGAVVERGSFVRLFVRRNQTTFRTSNVRSSLYPLPETPIPLHPPSPLPSIPQNSSWTAGKRSFTVLH